jgi:N-acetylmuramoyl-L-alanine amidase
MDAPAVKAVLETVMDMDASWDTGVGVVVLPSFITLQAVVNKARNNRVNLFISLLAWWG